VFLYGSTIWGILPAQRGISWESHALGALAGLITAYNFRKEGPSDKTYDLGDDEENANSDVKGDEEPEYGLQADNEVVIHYHYKEDANKNKEEENKA
jgi:hypothetical protein